MVVAGARRNGPERLLPELSEPCNLCVGANLILSCFTSGLAAAAGDTPFLFAVVFVRYGQRLSIGQVASRHFYVALCMICSASSTDFWLCAAAIVVAARAVM